jgi:SAM-dependent methyltransferase
MNIMISGSRPRSFGQEEQGQALPASAHPFRSTLSLRCPRCFENMGAFDPLDSSLRPVCEQCGFVLLNSDGIWEALAPDREERFRQFVREYQTVRAQEGRGSPCADFYLALPYEDVTRRNRWQWAIRARSYRFLDDKLLPQIEQNYPQGMNVLDIGAGNGWLSYRLALRGHRPVAVDLLDNDEDGLGAARHYFPCLPSPFARFQGEMDRLPFAEAQFDLALFNASFHYSENYERTLRETLRCLGRPGNVIILDSPFYAHDVSGRQMVQERQAEFQKRYGFPSNSIPCREYLTDETLGDLARACGLRWSILKPWYGLGWAFRPLKARLLGRRQPAKFYLLLARALDS